MNLSDEWKAAGKQYQAEHPEAVKPPAPTHLSIEPDASFDWSAYNQTVQKAEESSDDTLTPQENLENPTVTWAEEELPRRRAMAIRHAIDVAPAFAKDVVSSLGDYAKGAYQAIEEVARAKNEAAKTDPLIFTGTPIREGITNAPAAPTNSTKNVLWNREADKQLLEGTVAPVVNIGAFLPGTVGTVSAALNTPMIANSAIDIGKRNFLAAVEAEKTPAEKAAAAAGSLIDTAKEIVFGSLAEGRKMTSSDTWDAFFEKHPAQAIGMVGMQIAPTVTLAHPIISNSFRASKATKEMRQYMKDTATVADTTKPVEEVKAAQARIDAFKNKHTEPKTRADEIREESEKQTPDELKAQEEQKQAQADFETTHAEEMEQRKNASLDPNDYPDINPEELELNRKIQERQQAFEDVNGQTVEERATTGSYSQKQAMNDNNIKLTVGDTSVEAPVTRNEIYDLAKDILPAIKTGMGNLKKTWLGAFFGDTDVIRTRKFGTFGVLSHELGHYVDELLGITGFDKELIGVAKENWGKGVYKNTELRGEGIAEFMREYLLNPDEAAKRFPGYSAEFAKKCPSDLKAKLDNLGDHMRKWYKQSPEAQLHGSIVAGEENKGTWSQRASDFLDKTYTDWVDAYHPLELAVERAKLNLGRDLTFGENVYLRSLIAETKSAHIAEMMLIDPDSKLTIATLNKLYDGKLKHEVVFKDIMDSIDENALNVKYPDYLKDKQIPDWREAFKTYLVAKHCLDVIRVKGGENVAAKETAWHEAQKLYDSEPTPINKAKVTRAEKAYAEALKEPYKSPLESTDGTTSVQKYRTIVDNAPKELEDAAQKFYQFNDNLLSIAEWGGFIDAATHKTLRDKYPNYCPLMRELPNNPEYHQLSGSDQLVNFGNYIKSLSQEGSSYNVKDPLESTIMNLHILVQEAERNKIASDFLGLAELPHMGELAEEWVGGAKTKDLTVSVWKNGKQLTYAVDKALYDCLTYHQNRFMSNSVFQVMKRFSSGLRRSVTWTPDFLFANFLMDTVFYGIVNDTGVKPYQLPGAVLEGFKKLYLDKELYYEFKAAGVPLSTAQNMQVSEIAPRVKNYMGGIPSKVHTVTSGITEALNSLEEVNRINEFSRARQMGKSIDEAGVFARDATVNFGRAGVYGRKVNQITPFFNAAIQGTDKMIRTMKLHPARTAMRISTYIIAPTLFLWYRNHADPRYRDLPQDIRDRNYVVGFDKDGSAILLPKQREYGYLFGTSMERALDYLYSENNRKGFGGYGSFLASQMLPDMLPQFLKLYAENSSGIDFFTGKPIIPKKLEGQRPENQYDINTSYLARKLGMLFGVSPVVIDHDIKGVGGTTAKLGLSVTDALVDAAQGQHSQRPAQTKAEIANFTRFYRSSDKRSSAVDDYFSGMTALGLDKNDPRVNINSPATKKLNSIKNAGYDSQIKDLTKQWNKIHSSPTLTPTEKRNQMTRKYNEMRNVAKKANKIIYGN